MGVAWVAYSALGRQLSRHWTLPFRGLAVLGYWVLIGATFADPVVCQWIAQFYADRLAMPTTALFMVMDGPVIPLRFIMFSLGFCLVPSLHRLGPWHCFSAIERPSSTTH